MHSSVFIMGVSAVWCEFVLWDALSGAPNKSFLSTQQNLDEQKEFNNKCGKLLYLWEQWDRKWVHLGKTVKFYQESPIPVQKSC